MSKIDELKAEIEQLPSQEFAAGEVVSVWSIRSGEEVPRFLPAYPGGRS